jgi:hypothetical protein
MYFIPGLQKAGKRSVIMVAVDCLSNYAHFCASPHPFKATMVAQVFIDWISNSMACQHPLCLIVTQISSAHFGKNCLNYRAQN